MFPGQLRQQQLFLDWRSYGGTRTSRLLLMRTLILSTFLYPCESWTLTAEIERKIQALEMRCYHFLQRPCDERGGSQQNPECNWSAWYLLIMVKKRTLRWYGHISRSSGMVKTILQGTVKGARRRGRQKRWEIPWGQRKTGKGGKVLLQRHLWCPDDLRC